MGKILVYLVHPDKSLEKRSFKCKENKLILGKDREITFSPEHVFLLKRKLLPPKQCLILVEGKGEPEKLSDVVGDAPGLFPKMTYTDVAELIKREVAKARMRVKPITLNLFVILLIMHIVTIVLILALMKGVRIG
jgi:hypothetical protein